MLYYKIVIILYYKMITIYSFFIKYLTTNLYMYVIYSFFNIN